MDETNAKGEMAGSESDAELLGLEVARSDQAAPAVDASIKAGVESNSANLSQPISKKKRKLDEIASNDHRQVPRKRRSTQTQALGHIDETFSITKPGAALRSTAKRHSHFVPTDDFESVDSSSQAHAGVVPPTQKRTPPALTTLARFRFQNTATIDARTRSADADDVAGAIEATPQATPSPQSNKLIPASDDLEGQSRTPPLIDVGLSDDHDSDAFSEVDLDEAVVDTALQVPTASIAEAKIKDSDVHVKVPSASSRLPAARLHLVPRKQPQPIAIATDLDDLSDDDFLDLDEVVAEGQGSSGLDASISLASTSVVSHNTLSLTDAAPAITETGFDDDWDEIDVELAASDSSAIPSSWFPASAHGALGDCVPTVVLDEAVIDVFEDDLLDFDVHDEFGPVIALSTPLCPSSPSGTLTRPVTPARPVSPAKSCANIGNTLIEIADLTTLPINKPIRQSSIRGKRLSDVISQFRTQALSPPDPSTTVIVRPLFPSPAADRSPITGLSTTTVLRTCFRLGEALNVGCAAARARQEYSLLIELYARVESSYREMDGVKETGQQYFMLKDLYHEEPTVQAVWDGWKGCGLWDDDARRFLACGSEGEDESSKGGGGKLCRAVGRMSRDTGQWVFVISCIWEAGWEDVAAVRDVVCA